jgi:pimeloyl-ACP methyl ester carboxylesterase
MLAAVLAGPDVMLAGYDPHVLLPKIRCPVLLLQADPQGPPQGGLLRDEEVALGLRLLSNATHVRLEGVGHPLNQTAVVISAITPFLETIA